MGGQDCVEGQELSISVGSHGLQNAQTEDLSERVLAKRVTAAYHAIGDVCDNIGIVWRTIYRNKKCQLKM